MKTHLMATCLLFGAFTCLTSSTAWASSHTVYVGPPNGTDDTTNIQAAFDTCVAYGKNCTVQLAAGTYHTGQVAVIGFVGTFRGVGTDETIIQTLDRTLQVAPLNFFENPPTPESGSNPWPSIFAFVGGDIVISDLSLYFTPNVWTTGWTWTGLGTTVYELAHGFVVVGPVVPGQNYTEANAALYRVHIEGVEQEGTLTGYDPINATYYEGILGAPVGQALPLRGRFDAHDCEVRHAGGINLFNLYDSRASITRNRFADSFEGMDIGGVITNTTYEFADNEMSNISLFGLLVYGPFDSSSLVVRNNVITGSGMGLYLDDSVTFAGHMNCDLLRNSVEDVADVGIYLGPGTRDCLVVLKTCEDTVLNLGTNNKIVGCRSVAASGTMKKNVRAVPPPGKP